MCRIRGYWIRVLAILSTIPNRFRRTNACDRCEGKPIDPPSCATRAGNFARRAEAYFFSLRALPRKDFYEKAIMELRKEIEMVVARLKEQDSKIQRVSDRVQMSKLVVGGAKTTPR